MSSLEKVQKVMRVLQILSRIAMIVVYVSAGITLIGSILIGFGIASIPVVVDVVGLTKVQAVSILVAAAVVLVLNGILLTWTYTYFKEELKEGTPFTVEGATRLKLLGIKNIVLAIVSSIIIETVYQFNNLVQWSDFDSSDGVMLGICLILISLVFRYGAELEQKSRTEDKL